MNTDSLVEDDVNFSMLRQRIIEKRISQYRLGCGLQGETIAFPVQFTKENGLWKIMEY